MAVIQHFALGCSHLYFGGNELGISRDGIDVGIDPRWNDISSDCYGGAAGVPSDSQLMGAIVRIAAELTAYSAERIHAAPSYDPDHPILPGGVGSVNMREIGTFVRQGANPLARVLDVRGTIGRVRFPVAFMRQPQDLNLGSRNTTFTLGWEAWLNGTQTRLLMEWLAPV